MRSKKTLSLKSEKRITEVTSVIAHQLKTPLAGIKSSIEVLLSGDLGKLSPEQEEYLRLAYGGTDKMIQLVKNLLDASRIDESRMTLEKSPSDFVEIVRTVIKDLTAFASAKNTTISLDVPSPVALISIDATKIQEVVTNIIYNAIRYNKGKGNIKVAVTKNTKEVLFACADSGVGITTTDRKKIFSKFYRSPRVVALAAEGSGLGLFISKAIIMASGGTIWFESVPEKGTTFYFTLPLR